MSECDFCLASAKTLIPINDGLWAICAACNDYAHIQMNIINQHRKLKKLCGHGVPFADCGCEEE